MFTVSARYPSCRWAAQPSNPYTYFCHTRTNSLIRHCPHRKLAQARRIASADNPIRCNAGTIAPRSGSNAPLTSIHSMCSIEDLDLTSNDEHITLLGKGKRYRTILLDGPGLVNLLRQYLRKHHYEYGPLFRAYKNGRGGPLRYQSVQELWVKYCQQAGITCSLHQLRHAHATELINDGVSLATIRKRLGHRNTQTTLRYAELFDREADAELRAWRREK